MSDLSAAAAALGVPEAIVQRSAAARAAETGMAVDEVLAAWAGGGSVAAPGRVPTEIPEAAPPEAEVVPLGETPAPPPEPTIEIPEVASPAPAMEVTTISGKPPVLVGNADNPIAVLVGAVGLFVAIFLVGLVGPAMPVDEPGARSSDLPYTGLALRGQEVYRSVGCGSCHTQMVRPIVSDVGLGGVTLSDSSQVLGSRRFGPDLSDAGTRLSGSQIEALMTGFGGHPAIGLSAEDLESLVAYLLESKTSVAAPATATEAGEEESG